MRYYEALNLLQPEIPNISVKMATVQQKARLEHLWFHESKSIVTVQRCFCLEYRNCHSPSRVFNLRCLEQTTVGNASRGFKVTGNFPFNNNALPDHLFYALADSEAPVPENTTQEGANESSKVLINTPQINLQPEEPGTSSVKPPSPTKHLHEISPIPRLSQVTEKHRIKKTAVLLTSIDNRNALKANLEKRFQ
ncbi:hypothetical protein AVEN_60229-1 [Araneus ventricosus]|uniref:DUF4817 domain-containing protein n=1 Tax=Araneus ventricosus TaxID=182803 RepID=A0A4Y2CKW9_ARAVE|nr:hypothetical protein AVEN_60229-1 [Araneus ventricosus]